jgi:hypothetical protein
MIAYSIKYKRDDGVLSMKIVGTTNILDIDGEDIGKDEWSRIKMFGYMAGLLETDEPLSGLDGYGNALTIFNMERFSSYMVEDAPIFKQAIRNHKMGQLLS